MEEDDLMLKRYLERMQKAYEEIESVITTQEYKDCKAELAACVNDLRICEFFQMEDYKRDWISSTITYPLNRSEYISTDGIIISTGCDSNCLVTDATYIIRLGYKPDMFIDERHPTFRREDWRIVLHTRWDFVIAKHKEMIDRVNKVKSNALNIRDLVYESITNKRVFRG
jgi:hypothetical protein